MGKLINLIPAESIKLVKYSASDLIERLGKDVICNVVESVLCGGNIRHLTEGLTQRRILLMNASLVVTYMKALNSIDNFTENLSTIVEKELKTKRLNANVKAYLYWFLGLTGKSIQNVVRDDEGFKRYLFELDKNLVEISKYVTEQYGDLEMNLSNNGVQYLMQWPALLRCMLAMGAQTLTIRGSEKSMYGKLFEKLVLGSALTLLGAKYIDKNDTSQRKMVFWLSQTDEEKRECDATLLIRAGFGVRFDIGFVGEGNSEIPADKLSRYERVSERGNKRLYTTTVILIDKLGRDSNVHNIARRNGDFVIQMSNSYWLYELVKDLKEEFEFFEHPLLSMKKEKSISYIREHIKDVDMSLFVNGLEEAESSEEEKPKPKRRRKAKG